MRALALFYDNKGTRIGKKKVDGRSTPASFNYIMDYELQGIWRTWAYAYVKLRGKLQKVYNEKSGT